MKGHKGFSLEAVRKAALDMRLGIKPKYCVSDKFSTEDIEQALRTAAEHVFRKENNHV